VLKNARRLSIFILKIVWTAFLIIQFQKASPPGLVVRFAIISDIHSNLEALSKALDLIDEHSVDEIVCLGDIVGYGANPNECIRLVRNRCRIVLLGNHDAAALNPVVGDTFTKNARIAIAWTREQLNAENKAFLERLPLTARRDGVLFVHGSPYQPALWYYVISEEEAEAAFQSFSEQICFIGHSHFPAIFSEDGPVRSISRDSRHLVNVGSVGQPRDGNSRLSIGIFDTTAWSYKNIRSDYPAEIAAGKILQAGLPRALADRLTIGM
jgi:predicted phosphodiesterase